jgi:hypothetical protein
MINEQHTLESMQAYLIYGYGFQKFKEANYSYSRSISDDRLKELWITARNNLGEN